MIYVLHSIQIVQQNKKKTVCRMRPKTSTKKAMVPENKSRPEKDAQTKDRATDPGDTRNQISLSVENDTPILAGVDKNNSFFYMLSISCDQVSAQVFDYESKSWYANKETIKVNHSLDEKELCNTCFEKRDGKYIARCSSVRGFTNVALQKKIDNVITKRQVPPRPKPLYENAQKKAIRYSASSPTIFSSFLASNVESTTFDTLWISGTKKAELKCTFEGDSAVAISKVFIYFALHKEHHVKVVATLKNSNQQTLETKEKTFELKRDRHPSTISFESSQQAKCINLMFENTDVQEESWQSVYHVKFE